MSTPRWPSASPHPKSSRVRSYARRSTHCRPTRTRCTRVRWPRRSAESQGSRAPVRAVGSSIVLTVWGNHIMKQQHASPWAILAVTSLAVFAVLLDALVLFVAFPSIARSFSTVSSAELSWVLNGYTIVYGALLVPAGRLADRVGRKRVFLAGATLFTGASMLCGLAASPAWLIAARVLQAVGGAMLTPTSLALTLAAFSQQRRSVAVA